MVKDHLRSRCCKRYDRLNEVSIQRRCKELGWDDDSTLLDNPRFYKEAIESEIKTQSSKGEAAGVNIWEQILDAESVVPLPQSECERDDYVDALVAINAPRCVTVGRSKDPATNEIFYSAFLAEFEGGPVLHENAEEGITSVIPLNEKMKKLRF